MLIQDIHLLLHIINGVMLVGFDTLQIIHQMNMMIGVIEVNKREVLFF
jgi:hypothetical protein